MHLAFLGAHHVDLFLVIDVLLFCHHHHSLAALLELCWCIPSWTCPPNCSLPDDIDLQSSCSVSHLNLTAIICPKTHNLHNSQQMNGKSHLSSAKGLIFHLSEPRGSVGVLKDFRVVIPSSCLPQIASWSWQLSSSFCFLLEPFSGFQFGRSLHCLFLFAASLTSSSLFFCTWQRGFQGASTPSCKTKVDISSSHPLRANSCMPDSFLGPFCTLFSCPFHMWCTWAKLS